MFWKKDTKELPLAWEMEKDGKKSWLIGTIHMTSSSYKDSLEKYVSKSESIAFEAAPDDLKDESKKFGREFIADDYTLDDLLDKATVDKIKTGVGRIRYFLYKRLVPPVAYLAIYGEFIKNSQKAKNGVELEAIELSKKYKMPIRGLETAEEEIKDLLSIPVEKWIEEFKDIDNWNGDHQKTVNAYDSGDLDTIMLTSKKDGLLYEKLVKNRDLRLYERAKPLLGKGSSLIMIGAAHCEGFLQMAANDGYTVKQERIVGRQSQSTR